MMNRRLLIVSFVMTLLLSAAQSYAHERFRFVGTVVKMDVAKKLLTIKTGQKDHPPEIEIGITDKTRIERDGRTVKQVELKPGRYVVVDALGDDLLDTDAVTIKLVPAPAAKAGGAK